MLSRTAALSIVSGLALAASAGLATAQSTPPAAGAGAAAPAPQAAAPTARSPQRQTLARMMRPLSLNVREQRLEEVIAFIQTVTQAELEPIWQDASNSAGLDKERLITINVTERPALNVLEAVLAKAQTDVGQNTWQMTEHGAMEFGPKEALNRNKRLVIYDIHDLLMIIPNYPEVPQIDLSSVLQQSGGGGGGRSPFNNNQDNNRRTREEVREERERRTRDLIDLIQQTVETDQWVDTGGEGGTIRAFNNTLLINAPDYMHRQINGYPYWPSTARTVNGKRYVSLSTSSSLARIDGFATDPVSAVTPGSTTGGGGGGGGGTPGSGPRP